MPATSVTRNPPPPANRDATERRINKNPFETRIASLSTSPNLLHQIDSLCHPAFTEAAHVGCHFAAFETTVRRLSHEGESQLNNDWHWDPYLDSKMMDLD